MRPRLLLTGNRISLKFAVDFFATGLHTRTAVARLPLRQLGFLVFSCHGNQPAQFTAVRTAISVVYAYICSTIGVGDGWQGGHLPPSIGENIFRAKIM